MLTWAAGSRTDRRAGETNMATLATVRTSAAATPSTILPRRVRHNGRRTTLSMSWDIRSPFSKQYEAAGRSDEVTYFQ